MKTGSILTIIAAVAAVVVAIIASGGGGDDAKSGSTGSTPVAPAGSQTLSFVVSPEKEQLLKAVVAKFNGANQEVAGKRVFVSMKAMNSGDAQSAIARGRLQPDVWSPAGSFWGRLLNLRADKPYVATDNPSIVRTPLVIAMWEPMAQALGYPRKSIGFRYIVALSPGYLWIPPSVDTSQRIFIVHGRHDEILPFSNVTRGILPDLERAGLRPRTRWFNGGHTVDQAAINEALDFALGPPPPR